MRTGWCSCCSRSIPSSRGSRGTFTLSYAAMPGAPRSASSGGTLTPRSCRLRRQFAACGFATRFCECVSARPHHPSNVLRCSGVRNGSASRCCAGGGRERFCGACREAAEVELTPAGRQLRPAFPTRRVARRARASEAESFTPDARTPPPSAVPVPDAGSRQVAGGGRGPSLNPGMRG
jgi:hypothetical protein